MTALFTVPIPACDDHPGGTVVCSELGPGVYLLTFTSPPDNRLTTAFCQAMLTALDIVEFSYPPGVLVTTSGIAKFYSNGLDLDHAQAVDGFWAHSLYRLFARFLTYPMPTVALINGHAFAGGLMMSMHHDYRVMNPAKGFVCLNELDFGAALKAPMSSIFRLKLSGHTYRSLVLEAKRFPGSAALEAGIVDVLGGADEALRLIKERDLTKKGKTGVYGLLKMEMYRESLEYLSPEGHDKSEARDRGLMEAEDERMERGRKAVEEWKVSGKAKL